MDATPLDTALAYWQNGRAEAALAALDAAAGQPEWAARARSMQAVILRNLWRHGEALAKAVQAIQLDPALAEAWECAGYLLLSRKQWAEAEQLLALAISTIPNRALLLAYYAMALTKTGKAELAYLRAGEALRLRPDLPEALLAYIEILNEAGYYDLALRRSAALQTPRMRETAIFFEGATAFMTGDMTRGMRLLAVAMNTGWRGGELSEWDGTRAAGGHIVLYGGQGNGDTIQFARYIDCARPRARRVTLFVPQALERLMRDSFPDFAVASEMPADATLRCSLPSLAAFADAFDPLADRIPYIKARPELAAVWREKLAHLPKLRVGLAWSSPLQMNNPSRAMSFQTLRPLLDIPGIGFVSLQLGDEAKQAAEAGLFDAAPFIRDFADSAALMSELDLVISLDSAPAHLAGALGKPVWMFLPFSAEWRWLVGREDSIWYPSMRLFRQDRPQDWGGVIGRMASGLQSFLSGDRSVLRPTKWDGITLRRHPNAIGLPGLD